MYPILVIIIGLLLLKMLHRIWPDVIDSLVDQHSIDREE